MNYIGGCDNSLPIPYPHAVKARMKASCPKIRTRGENYAKKYFCARWGQHYPCICPDPYEFMTEEQFITENKKCSRSSTVRNKQMWQMHYKCIEKVY